MLYATIGAVLFNVRLVVFMYSDFLGRMQNSTNSTQHSNRLDLAILVM